MPNTSATGGYLAPTTAPTNDAAFEDFLQAVLVGLTGLSGSLVRPAWQADPPQTPPASTDWLAFAITAQAADFDAYQRQESNGTSTMLRHEALTLQVYVYGPSCIANASRVRDGLEIAQNRDALRAAGVGLTEVGEILHVPELINDRWVQRADMSVALTREVSRSYPILHFLGADGDLLTDGPHELTTDFAVAPEA